MSSVTPAAAPGSWPAPAPSTLWSVVVWRWRRRCGLTPPRPPRATHVDVRRNTKLRSNDLRPVRVVGRYNVPVHPGRSVVVPPAVRALRAARRFAWPWAARGRHGPGVAARRPGSHTAPRARPPSARCSAPPRALGYTPTTEGRADRSHQSPDTRQTRIHSTSSTRRPPYTVSPDTTLTHGNLCAMVPYY
jgi:hypothetical protein